MVIKKNVIKKVASMARRFGKTVLRTKADLKLDPMPADERKVMHQEIAKMDHLKTESKGEGKNRIYDNLICRLSRLCGFFFREEIMENLIFSLNATVPVFAMIILGMLFKK